MYIHLRSPSALSSKQLVGASGRVYPPETPRSFRRTGLSRIPVLVGTEPWRTRRPC